MPTYAYRCTNPDCAHTFDVVQGFHDAPVTECPVCGQPVRKVFSPVGVVFKGSGFYRTDSRGGSTESSSSSSSSSESKSETKASSGSDSGSASTKPAANGASSSSSSANGGSTSSSTSSAKAS